MALWLAAGALPAAAGTISTVAGNGTAGYNGENVLATSAELSDPYSVTADNSNNIYICDFGGNRIQKVDAVTGLITTVAGTGTSGYNGDGIPATAAQVNGPIGACVDDCGNLYFAEYFGNRVRRVDAVTGLISTVAGTGVAGYNGDGIPATTAQLNVPHCVAVDSLGRLYIADRSNYRCRRVDFSMGLISTVAGTGSSTYGGDGSLATAPGVGMGWVEGVWVAPNLDIYLSISGDANVRKVTAATGLISTFVSGVTYPLDVCGDCGGNIFVGNDSNIVYEVSPLGVASVIAGNGTYGFSGDGGPATAAQIDQPSGVFVNTLGDLLIADSGNERIRRVQAQTTPCVPPSCFLTPVVTATPTNSPTATLTPTTTNTPVPTLTPTPSCQFHVWPDPFSIQFAHDNALKFGCLPTGSQVSIYTLSGELVTQFGQDGDPTEWVDAKNQKGTVVSPGIYFFVVEMGGKVLQRGKFLIKP